MQARDEHPICHVTACERPVEYTCDGCGKPCCAEHCRAVAIERRDYGSSETERREPLARITTRTETYMLCRRCSTKPVTASAGRQRTIPS